MHGFGIARGFITLLIPSALRHVSWNFPYHYSAKTQTFHQPTLASWLLDRMNAHKNEGMFKELKITEQITFTPDVAPGIGGSKKLPDVTFKGKDISDLCRFGAREPSVSTEVFEIVMERIRTQKQSVQSFQSSLRSELLVYTKS
jgi:hypothetical protein